MKIFHVGTLHPDMEEFIMDAEVIDDLFENQDPKKVKKLEKELIKRFKRHEGNPAFKALGERLEEIRNRAEQGLLQSIDFVKELCKLAKETLIEEEKIKSELEKRSATEALTELFLELKTEKTPAVVERIVADIDEIVKIVRFPGWQSSLAGEREVKGL